MANKTKVTFLEASNSLPLSKYFGLTSTRSYPYVKDVTSHEKTVEKTNEGLAKFADLLQTHANLGHCLLKGNLKRPLVNESRAGLTDKRADTDFLIIDLDGIDLPNTHLPRRLDGPELVKLTNGFIDLLPKELSTVSYVVQGSASMGMKGNLSSLHIYMFLEVPIPAKAIKLWLKNLNLTTPDVASQITLSANGQSLSWPVDLSIADSTHTCFIAPPVFEDKQLDPFLKASDRTVLVRKKNPTIDLVPLAMGLNPEIITEKEIVIKNKLRIAAGLKKKSTSIKQMPVRQQIYEVLMNPDRMHISVYNDQNYPFVHCDVNGGDSHAYYFFADAPMYMYNFKGEPIWEIAKADPEFYSQIPDLVNQNKGKRPLAPIALRDFTTGTYYNGLYDSDLEQFDDSFPLTPTKKDDISGFYQTQNFPVPSFVQDAKVVFDPEHTGKNVNLDEKPMAYINMYRKTKYMFNAIEPAAALSYTSAHDLKSTCPNIYKIIFHMLGSGEQEFSHFLNWLAFIYQNKRKSETCWVLSGIQGTGKGVFANRILNPLFGPEHAPMKSLENIEEQFNVYLRHALFLVVDEFRMSDSRGPIRMADKLKNSITEPYLTIRAMRANQLVEKSYVNYLFFTNRHDSIQVEPNDRRYNIAPRQEQTLRATYPEVIKVLETKGLDREIYHLAGALSTFEVSETQIRLPLHNIAKEVMQKVTMSVFDEFIDSIKTGSIGSFTDLLDMSLSNTMQAGEITSAQRYVKFWMSEAFNRVPYTVVPIEQLRMVYHILTEQTPRLSLKQFTKNLNRHGLTKVRKRPHKAKNSNPATGIEIQWRFASEAETESLIDQYFDDKDQKLLSA